MRAVSSALAALLLGAALTQAQYYPMGPVPGTVFGAHPTMYGPNYPQVQGVNVQGFGFSAGGFPGMGMVPPTLSAANPAIQARLASTPNTAGPIFPQCSSLDSIGSPVLLIYQASEIINKLLDPKNANAFVSFIHFTTSPDTTNGLFQLYTLIFSLSDYLGTYYAGMRFRVSKAGTSDPNFSQSGLGDAEFQVFVMNEDCNTVYGALDLTAPATAPNPINCGDLKFIFSSYGNSVGSAVPGQYPGQNQNGALAALVEQFKAKEKSFNQRTSDPFDLFFRATVPSGSPSSPDRAAGWLKYLEQVKLDMSSN